MESLNARLHAALGHRNSLGAQGRPWQSSPNQVVVKAIPTKASVEEEIIKEELRKERDKIARRAEEEEAARLLANDKARKEMREWWLERWEAKKRSQGWGNSDKCWILRSADGSEVTTCAVISGEGVLVGAAPLVSESIKSFIVDLPMVSSIHAHVYGKDVLKSYKKYVREYFVVDLGSTNGTYLNRSKLRPRTEVKLSSGDTLKFGDPKAVFVVESQK